jgi:ABC-type branched-subunit amino acid transport system ATPase component/ABC-type branched-subunit amino acid transport system permease subunit
LNTDKYYLLVLSLTGIAAIAGTGLNILVGLSGQISLGHAAFYALGAYVVGLLTTALGFDFWAALAAAGLFTAATGLLLAIPALRAAGPYLAMITIAFGFVVEQGLVEWKSVTAGWDGISGIEMPYLFGLPVRERGFAFIILIALALSLIFTASLKSSAWGTAMQAVRDAPVAAHSIGLSIIRIRAVAFALSAAFTGLAGGLFAAVSSFISPDSFPFSLSIAFLLVVMIGGAGSIAGPVYGALVVVFAPEIFSWLAEYRVLAMGVLFLIVLRIAPGGVAGILSLAAEKFAALFIRDSIKAETMVDSDGATAFFAPSEPRGLVAKDLEVRFGGVHAVRAVSFIARAGQITSLVGPNGAGKTTVVNLICGFSRPLSGAVFLGQEDVTKLPAHSRAKRGIARTFQTAQLFSRLSVGSNVAIAAIHGGLGPRGLFSRHRFLGRHHEVAALLSFSGYGGSIDVEAQTLPHVDRRLVEIARALALKPALLALDEPAAGLDAVDKERLAKILRQVAAKGVTVLLIEHDMDLVMSISDHVVVLDAGAKIAEGPPADVRSNAAVKKAYLGDEKKTPPVAAAPLALTTHQTPILSANEIESGYGANLVLRKVSVEARKGETVAILGANGAGKSTLLRSLAGLNSLSAGTLRFDDRDITRSGAEERAMAGLALVPEGRQVFAELSVLDNLLLGAVHRPMADAGRDAEELLSRFPNLAARRFQRAGLLSGGEQQMLAIARGLIGKPKLLMLDEPSLGLAPLMVEAVYEWLSTLRDNELTIIIADQLASVALALSSRAYVLQGGEVVFEGESRNLATNPALLRAYLGDAVEAV